MRIPARQKEQPTGEARGSRVLVVDDDHSVAGALTEFLGAEGHTVLTAPDAEQALEIIRASESAVPEKPAAPIDVVLSDVNLPGMGGMSLLKEITRKHRATAVVMLTGYGTVESAVEALRLGACDYLVKPIVDSELRTSMERALRQRQLLSENAGLRRNLENRYSMEGVLGSDPRMLKVFEVVGAVAPSRTTVLMTGESGTGKSLVAHAIHHQSPRREKPFVELSCGSIPETLLESELFGHVKGAFTGAHVDKMGRFLAANGGTIFLDEINSASPAMQLKLLRVLQERRFEPVGSSQTVEVDVRVILASNQPLEVLVADGRFRQDLYYRINVVKIELPPLRERVGDIPALAAKFLERFGTELGRALVGFTPDALDALRRYAYPGNVRELQNIVERAAVLCRGQTVGIEDLPDQLKEPAIGAGGSASEPSAAGDGQDAWVPMTLDEALREPEKRILLKALHANAWNRQKTAEQLGINRTTLYKKLKALGIDAGDGGIRSAG